MKVAFWVRLNFLILGFLGCIYTIHGLHKKGIGEGLKQALVLNSRGHELSRTARFEKLTSLNLCNKPVQYVQRLGESQTQRIQRSANTHLASWLEANCALLISNNEKLASDKYEPLLLIGYSGGQKAVLYGNRRGEYQWAGRAFRSSQLDAALANMDRLLSEL